jgi:hypothetical protein
MRHAVNVPFLDEWTLAPLFAKLRTGELRFSDLWAQHNEHRIVFPRLVLLALGRLTHWNTRYECLASLAFALITLFLVWRLLVRTVGRLDAGLAHSLAIPASLLMFSLAQYDNWIEGFQIAVHLNVLGAVLATWALARRPEGWGGIAVASAGAVIASLSLASGLVVLGLIPLALAAARPPHWARYAAATLVVAAGVAAFYFYGYHQPPEHPGLHPILSYPGAFVQYVLAYLGTPLGAGQPILAMSWGLFGVLALGVSVLCVYTRVPELRGALIPWCLLAGYVMLSAAGTGLGRFGLGVEQALSSRYASIAAVFWIGVSAVSALALRATLAILDPGGPATVRLLCVTWCLATLAAMSYAHSYVEGETGLRSMERTLLNVQECVLYHDRDDVPPTPCARLYPAYPLHAEIVRSEAARLKAMHWGPFASGPNLRRLANYERRLLHPGAVAGWLDTVKAEDRAASVISRRRDRVLVTGWAIDPMREQPPVTVLVVVDDEVVGSALAQGDRPDVARLFGRPHWKRSGWTFEFGAFRLTVGGHHIAAYALLADGRSIVELAGGRPVEVLPD